MKRLVCFCLSVVIICGFFSFSVSAEPSIDAKGGILINADTGEIILQRNCNTKLPMASTTKIMTALILAEQEDLSKTILTTKEMVTVEGSSMGLLPGDTVSLKDLLYGMLLASGNDAANTTAIHLGGSVEGFAKLMNDKAKKIGLINTSFVTPSGLDDDNHYTTAYDLAVLTSVALQNQNFKIACSSKSATLYYGNPPYKRTLTNHNKLLNSYEGAIGVKTGFTKKSGRCLVSAATRNNVTLIAVTLGCPNDWETHKNMLDYGFKNTTTVTFDNKDIEDTLPVINSDCDLARIKAESVTLGITNSSAEKLVRKVNLPIFAYAPISLGEKVGSIDFYLEDKLIKSVDIISLAEVKVINNKEPLNKRFKKYLVMLLMG